MTSDLTESHELSAPGCDLTSSPHPGVGLHTDIPADVYHAWPLPSSTLINEMWRRSPAHVAHRRMEPLDSAALTLGRAVHTLVLEGIDALADRFAVAPNVDRRTKQGKEIYSAFCAEAVGKDVLTKDEAEQVRGIAIALREHTEARVHLEATRGHREVSGIFHPFEDSPMLAKFRPDGIAESFGALVDLKTTDSANPWDVRNTIVKWGYHRSAAHYLNGADVCGLEVIDFVFIFVEKEPPYGVGVYRLDQGDIAIGLQQVSDILRRWEQCEKSGIWPAYEGVQTVELPSWARMQTYSQRMRAGESEQGGEW